ncbi:MAG: c-type cytochrome [Planctomycetes bacterium]|nr:c-type cytochrome [Planctomycetota bacterium]
MRWFIRAFVGGIALAACGLPGPDRAHVDVLFGLDGNRLVPAASTAAQRELGRLLFGTPSGGSSCAQCHPRSQLGQDGRVHGRDTPALADVTRQVLFGRDGRERDLSAFVQREFAQRLGLADDVAVAAWVAQNPPLQAAFAAAGSGPSLAAAAQAVGAHLATWRTESRWDRYVDGDDEALSRLEGHGLAKFVEVGCAACHGGRSLGGVSAHVLGAAVPFPSTDPGRELATGEASDRNVWKAPMLRHAAGTGPWLHDGSVASLEQAVRLMGKHELGKELDDAEVAAIAAFLRAVADAEPTTHAAAAVLQPGVQHGR